MALTNVDIKNAKPRDKSYRLYDQRGLYLEVTPAGGKLWRLKYRFGGKEKRLAIGPYPKFGLKAAREARDSARSLRASGIDPSEQKKLQKAAQTKHTDGAFETLATEWHAGKSRVWSTIHSKFDDLSSPATIFSIAQRQVNQIDPSQLRLPHHF